MKKIAIIGAGLSGTTTAIYLLKYALQPVELFLFEENKTRLNKGVAYSQTIPYQPLNVVASGMSLYTDDSTHFVEWLRNKNIAIPGASLEKAFVRRDVFGNYIKDEFEKVIGLNPNKINVRGEVVTDINKTENTLVVTTSNGQIEVDAVLLATGNFPPADIPIKNEQFYKSSKYIANPWSSEVMLNQERPKKYLLVGAGLTMFDLAISLNACNPENKLISLSRRGYLPNEHRFFEKSSSITFNDIDFENTNLGALLIYFRKKVNDLKKEGIDWRQLMDALREHTPVIWKNLSQKDKAQFLRHVRPFWEVHRHRVPQLSNDRLKELVRKNTLEIAEGRIIDMCEKDNRVEVTYFSKKQRAIEKMMVDVVVNCTGPQSNYRKMNHPLIERLVQKKTIQSDELHLGLLTNECGALIGEDGVVSKNIFTIGPARKGMLWESTALREIRIQAKQFVETINNL
ncbi:MAG: FAD/NAD(P)-binding protein [Bacteroidetes bacterium]|nr:FAD/NAD(P)-binding protein [Bacteroidota bacterium]